MSSSSQKDFVYQELFDLKSNPDTTTKYRKLFDGMYVDVAEAGEKSPTVVCSHNTIG